MQLQSSKRQTLWVKQIIDQLVLYQQFRKNFKNVWKNKLNYYIQNHSSPYLCGYQKGYSTQQALLALIESRKKV